MCLYVVGMPVNAYLICCFIYLFTISNTYIYTLNIVNVIPTLWGDGGGLAGKHCELGLCSLGNANKHSNNTSTYCTPAPESDELRDTVIL